MPFQVPQRPVIMPVSRPNNAQGHDPMAKTKRFAESLQGPFYARPASGGGDVTKVVAPSTLRQTPRGFTQGDVIQHKVNPGVSRVQRNGRYLPIEEAMSLGPLQHQGWNTRMGRDDGRRIGSAAGAVGSGGTPTSMRGRADRVMMNGGSMDDAADAAMTPSWVVAEQMRNDGGLSQSQRFPSLLKTKPTGAMQSNAESWFSPPKPSGDVAFFADGTKDSGPKPQVAVVGERGPEVVVVPPRSAVIPNEMTALGEIVGDLSPEGAPRDGEIRTDADGNQWRYDAKQGRGIPLNPYSGGNEIAPSPDAFRASPSERYNDLAMRLNALRQSGMSEGRAAVERVKAQQDAETARREAFLATGKDIPASEGGGKLYKTKYGTAIVGGNRPKSFTVENFEGGQTRSGDLAEVNRESRADAAERSVRGLGTDVYRARPEPVPTAFAELAGDEALDEEMDEPVTQVQTQEADRPKPAYVPRPLPKMVEDILPGPSIASRKLPKSMSVVPRGSQEQSSRAGRFLDETKGRVGDALSAIPESAGNAWDFLFAKGGTKREQEARANLPAAIQRLKDRGFKITTDQYGNWTDIRR